MEELSPDLKNKRVLVVDDAGSMRSLLCSIIKCFGISRVYSAGNGAEAMVVINSQPIDIVFSDWEMPGKDGLTLYRELQGHPKFKEIPFVLVTSMAEMNKVKAALDQGISDYVVKPFKARSIYSKINKLFETSEK